jgi:integrase
LALERTIAMRDQRIGGYVATLAWTLVKCARYAKVLSPAEVEEVNQLYRRLSARRKAEKPLDTRRDEALLAQLDDPRVMDALLSLPSRTVERIIRSGRTDRMAALEVQKACALAIWLCAPLRLSNFVSLRLDQHFHRLQLKGKELVLVRLSPTEVKNAEALEHFLSEEAAVLLELYVRDFRPHLCGLECQWLVPGYGDGHKVAAAFSGQMKKYVEAATGVDFHPHLMRKIAAKICLDEDPAAIEIVRRCLGHRNTNTTRQSYTQAQQRAAQTRYLDMLEKRQLRAIGGWQARTKS